MRQRPIRADQVLDALATPLVLSVPSPCGEVNDETPPMIAASNGPPTNRSTSRITGPGYCRCDVCTRRRDTRHIVVTLPVGTHRPPHVAATDMRRRSPRVPRSLATTSSPFLTCRGLLVDVRDSEVSAVRHRKAAGAAPQQLCDDRACDRSWSQDSLDPVGRCARRRLRDVVATEAPQCHATPLVAEHLSARLAERSFQPPAYGPTRAHAPSLPAWPTSRSSP